MTPLTFEYRGFDRTGKARDGSVQAPTRNDAFRALVAQGLTPTHLTPARRAAAPAERSGGRFSADKLADFTHAIGVLIDAHVPLSEGLRSIAEQEPDAAMRFFALEIARRIEGGDSIATALDAHGAQVGPVYVEAVRAAERNGKLPRVLAHLSDMLERSQETIRIIRSALTYPACVIGALFAGMVVLTGLIMPRFAAIFAQRDAQLPQMTRSLMALGQSVHDFWFIYLGAALALVVIFRLALTDPAWRERFDALLHRVPIIKTMLIGVALSRFCRICGLSVSSGIPLVESIELAGAAAGRPLLAAASASLARSVNAGESLSDSLAKAPYFTPFAKRMLAAGERAGDLPRMCDVIARHYERECNHLARNIRTVIEPLVIIGVASLFLLIALSVFLPAWEVTRAIG